MIPIYILAGVFVCQIVGYSIFYRRGIKGYRYLLLAFLCFLCLFPLPMLSLYIWWNSLPYDQKPKCSTGDAMTYAFFWIVGIVGLLIIHFGFYLWYYIKQRIRKGM